MGPGNLVLEGPQAQSSLQGGAALAVGLLEVKLDPMWFRVNGCHGNHRGHLH